MLKYTYKYLLIVLFNTLNPNFSGHLKLVELKFEERLWVKKWAEQVITQSTVTDDLRQLIHPILK